ncbi:MAG: NADH-quinone oxidoreductase subunit J [Phycisphaerales bacterium]|nr:NADH-quinone oxidoreductase subunit J [Phycisphaerales bacterium]
MSEAIAFYLLAAVAGGCALGCVVATNIVRMAICLLGTLAAVALLYFLLHATFLGAIQLIVYAGGTLIVIVFGVMLTSRTYAARLLPRRGEALLALLVCLVLFSGLAVIFVGAGWQAPGDAPGKFTVAEFGQALLSRYLVPFEVASVLLLAVMIGAAYLAQPQETRRPQAPR